MCFIKFKNYPFEDAPSMQGIHLKDNMNLVNAYNDTCPRKQSSIRTKFLF